MYMYLEELKKLEQPFFFRDELVEDEEVAEEIINDNEEELLNSEEFVYEAVKAHVEINLYDILEDYFEHLEENSEIPEDWGAVLANNLPDYFCLEEMNEKIEKELPSFYVVGDPIEILDKIN